MKIFGRSTIVLAPLALLTAPAAWWLRSDDAPLVPLLYFAVMGVVGTFALLRWTLRDLVSSGRRGSRRATSRRELVRLKGLGLGPAEDGFEDSMQNVLGFSGAAGPLYCYFDVAMGKNHPWLGGSWSYGLAQGDPDADWETRFNINFGYYF